MNWERSALLAVGMVGLWRQGAVGQVQTFINDFDGWVEATGAFSTIDFGTLPDGSASVAGTNITEDFNYNNQGAIFSSPHDDLNDLVIGGNSISGFDLRTISDGTIEDLIYIQSDFANLARSVGGFFPGNGTLEVFDELGVLLASEFFNGSGSGFFLGITSEVPIAYALLDKTPTTSVIESFHFSPVPEPGTAGLLGLGALALWRRRRRPGVG